MNMARGWESKAVEAQQEEALRASSKNPAATPDQRARFDRRRALELTRTRAMQDRARASAPAHQAMLDQAIQALDAQIAQLRDKDGSA